MKAEFSTEPATITYMQLPDGRADVWLRENITMVTVTEESSLCEGMEEPESWTKWEADEVYFRTSLTQEEVEENFDIIFENGGPVVDDETGEEVADGITLETRVEALEEGLMEMASMLAE